MYDERWRPVSVNSAALDALAVSRAQLMGRAGHDPAWRIVGPDGEPIDPKQAPSAIAMRTGVETTGIVGATRGDGETTWLAVRAYCVDDYRKRLTIATFDVL